MPSFLETLFGKKKPTSDAASVELERRKAELAPIPGRIAAVEAKLKRVADLTEVEHKAALEELGTLQRALVRGGAQVDDLQRAYDAARKAEEAAALSGWAEAADRAIRRDYPAALAEYEAAAAMLAEKAAKLDALDHEVEGVNYAIQQARKADPRGEHPEFVKSSTERYRTQPDIVEPDREESTKEWFFDNQRCFVTAEYEGRQVPVDGGRRMAGAEQRTVTRTVPGRVRKGKILGSPQTHLALPATRLDGKAYWPRGS